MSVDAVPASAVVAEFVVFVERYLQWLDRVDVAEAAVREAVRATGGQVYAGHHVGRSDGRRECVFYDIDSGEFLGQQICHQDGRTTSSAQWAWLRYDQGIEVNKKKVHRLWKEEGLQVRRAPRRKRAGLSSVPVVDADAPNVVWALDFQFDSTVDGKTVKIASMVDEHTRMSLLNIVDRSITAGRLIEGLEKAFAMWGGPPLVLRMDNGPSVHLGSAAGLLCWVGGGVLHSAGYAVEQRVHRIVQQPVAR